MSQRRANYLSDPITEKCLFLPILFIGLGGSLMEFFGMTFFYVMCSLGLILFLVGSYRCYLTWRMFQREDLKRIIVKVDHVRLSVPNHRYVEFSYQFEGKDYPVKRDILDGEISDDRKIELLIDPNNPQEYRIVS